MVFYKIEAVRKFKEDKKRETNHQERFTICSEIAEKSESLFQKSNQESFVFMASAKENTATFGVIAKNKADVEKQFLRFEKMIPIEISNYKKEEITFAALNSLLTSADRNDYIEDRDNVLEYFELCDLSGRYGGGDFGEAMIDTERSLESIRQTADSLLFGETMLPEIERIYSSSAAQHSLGHPVHYLLRTDDRDTRKTIYKVLLSALYNNGRVKNKRYSFLDFSDTSTRPGPGLDALYRSSEGGTVVIRYGGEDDEDGQFGARGSEIIQAICEIACKYKNKVLTIVCLPKNSERAKEDFLSNWGFTAFVELYEDVVFGERARQYLKGKATENKIRCDKALLNLIDDENRGYTGADLNRIFDMWYDKKLRNSIYPQYKTAETVKAQLKNKAHTGSAYEHLQRLIGLASAKDVMDKALNFFRAQKLFADRGLKTERPSMHMVFTGNPGTAKTTVARLFAKVMKENGLVTSGEFYEVGRADLVGKYVGHTAPLVKAAFKKAKGGVLFIDEAYSLVDDRDGMFGDEAINTIVQEMENHRKDTVVIFAGYPDKMEAFLKKNPGLRSRIAFHIPFEDYTSSELCEIAGLIAADMTFKLSDDAKEKLYTVFEAARKSPDFGNGRFARNVIEKAKLSQANRLMKMDLCFITDEELHTISGQDIEIPETKNEPQKISIGFVA